MEYLALLVIYGVVRLVKGGTENTSAILKGTEPPEITKFNARRKDGSIAGKLAEAVSRPVGRPKAGKPAKEPGPARKVFRAWKANAAASAVDKMQHRHQRRLQWYREHGKSIEDEKWHTRQQAKLKGKQKKLEALKVKKGLADPKQVDGQVVDDKQGDNQQPVPENVANIDEARAKRGEDQNAEQQPKTPNTIPVKRETPEDAAKKHPLYCAAAPLRKHVGGTDDPTVCRWCHQRFRAQIKPQNKDEDKADPATSQEQAGTTTPQAGTTNTAAKSTGSAAAGTTGGNTGMSYEEAVFDLHENAADIDNYTDELKALADNLAARGYGAEITGPAADIAGRLQEAAGIMRDYGISMGGQGDNVARAYAAASFAPDRSELVGN